MKSLVDLPVNDTQKRWNLNPLQIGMGYFADKWSATDKFGKNPGASTVYEDVWAGGGTMTLLTTSSTMIVTSSGVDTPAGTGALTVQLQGLSNSYNIITEDVILNAAAAPTTTKSFIRVFRVKVLTAGTGLINANDIVITATTGGSEQARILADEGQTQQAIYTVERGHTAYIETCTLATDVAANRVVTAQLMVREFGGAWNVKHEVILGTGHVSFSLAGSGGIPEKSDVRWRAKASTGTTNIISAGFKILSYQE